MSFTNQQLFDQAKSFLEKKATKEDIHTLRQIIRWSDELYYQDSNPMLADAEYDALFTQLKDLEKEHPELTSEDSPTQKITATKNARLQNKQHAVPMLSLDNTYNAEDLLAWDQRCRNVLKNQEFHYCVEPKYDGASISLTYDNGTFTQALTRGDGLSGEDVSFNIRRIASLPMKLESKEVSHMEVRGEVVFDKEEFAALNEKRQEAGLSLLANPRNAASGTLRILDEKEAAKRKLNVILYHIANAEAKSSSLPFDAHAQSLEWLSKQGFPTPEKYIRKYSSIEEVIAYCNAFEEERDNLPFEIDGMVIKIDEWKFQDALGMTAHHPRWATAYKFKARQATSILERVEFQVGRTGSIAPVAKIKPVHIGGVTVTSVSLFNEDVIREKDLHIGDQILVERAGDVIPYIVKPLSELRTGAEQSISFPTHCPVCQGVLERVKDEAVWRCVNINCTAQVVERMIHFASKDAMDIRGLGDSLIRKFYEQGFLKDIPGIYHLPFDTIGTLEGFGKKSIDNLQQAIEKSKNQPLHRLLYGLGIRHVGETMSKTLAQRISQIEDLYSMTEEQLMQMEDVGPKVANAIVQFFEHHENREIVQRLKESGLNTFNQANNSNNKGGILDGTTFLFTGTLQKMKRGEAEEIVEAAGGKILSGVSSKLNFLVVGEDAGSKLEKAKKLGSVRILSEDDFLKMMNNQ